MYQGEVIAITVALMWTACAIFSEAASRRIGSLCFNVVRMSMSLLMLLGMLWWFMGSPYPVGADATTWFWLALSGFIGYVLGDYCLINGYVLIGSRYGQLLMTLAPPTAAVFGWLMMGQRMTMLAVAGMLVTLSGISIAILKPGKQETKTDGLPTKGIMFGIGAAVGQGLGLVLSAKGLMHYEAQMDAVGMTFRHEASAAMIVPFAATAIRAIVGCLGFIIWLIAKKETAQLRKALRNRRAMWAVVGSTVTGPFIGVSLSLMATMYTAVGIAQTIMALTPVLIILPTYLIFHQKVQWQEVIGAIISVCGVSLFFI